MARRFGIGMVVLMALGFPGIVRAEADAVKVAVFSADITPPIGSVQPYGMGPAFNRVTDPLLAKGIVLLPEGQEPIVICALDWVSIGDEGYDAFRNALAAAVKTSPQRVAVQSLHVHGAPAGGIGTEKLAAEHGAANLHCDVAVTVRAVAQTAEAAQKSLAGAVPATHVGVGKGRVERVASNRRILGDDGKVKTWRGSGPSKDPTMFQLPEGLIDPDVRLIAVWSGDRPVAALTYYANHPMSQYGDGEISADFVGIARNARDAAVPGISHVFFNGGGGNIAPGKYNEKGIGSRDELARRLADGMQAAWEAAQASRVPLSSKEVAWKFVPVQLPVKANLNEAALLAQLANPKLDKLEKVFCAEDLLYVRRNAGAAPTELSRLTLGPAEIVHYPGEPFVEYQLAAQKMRPDRFVCFAGYGEYGPVYISTEIGHFQGGFEAERWCRTAIGAERALLAATRTLLDAVPLPEISAEVSPGAGGYVQAVLEDRPTAYYRLGEAKPDAGLRDSSNARLEPGAIYGGAVCGEPGALAGDTDAAMRFDGQKSWALASTTLANIRIRDGFSVELWAKSATPKFNAMAWFAGRRGPDGFLFGPDIRTEGDKTIQGISGWVVDDQGRTDAAIRSTPLPDDFDADKWHHYALTYDPETDTGVIYLDGKPLVTRPKVLAATGGKRSKEALINLSIGRDDAMPGRFGDGWLDEVAVYDRPLTPEQIEKHVAAGLATKP